MWPPMHQPLFLLGPAWEPVPWSRPEVLGKRRPILDNSGRLSCRSHKFFSLPPPGKGNGLKSLVLETILKTRAPPRNLGISLVPMAGAGFLYVSWTPFQGNGETLTFRVENYTQVVFSCLERK